MNQFARLFAVSGISLERLRTFLDVAEAGNLSRAAAGDPTRQSQYSRQIKELEAYFGTMLTRKVGRRIEITEQGKQLAALIRESFRDLDDFREAMAGRGISVRIGSQGSVIHWWLIPHIGTMASVLGGASMEIEPMRTMDVVRGISDGRLDFGILRADAVPRGLKKWPLGTVGYSYFLAKKLCKKPVSLGTALANFPTGELLPGGQFSRRLNEWHGEMGTRLRIAARVSSFTELATFVRSSQGGAVLPDLAAADLPQEEYHRLPIPGLYGRSVVLIANARSLERSGIRKDAGKALATMLCAVNQREGSP